jgi:glucose-6-phosphate 1-dehydrogenase
MNNQQPALKPFALTIFGITGDLASRMLLPALYDLAAQKLLPSSYRIVGISRREIKTEELLGRIRATLQANNAPCDEAVLGGLSAHLEMLIMDTDEPEGYARLRRRLNAIETETGFCMNRLCYMAIPASAYETVIAHLGQSGLNQNCPHGTGDARLLIEKPFGTDLASAKALIRLITQHFDETQVYRIDHFLAKETAQNVLAFRFQNALFRAVWDRRHISHVLVSATETLDIQGRAEFYEQTGALRDMVQSHVLQMLALAAMDIPETNDAADLHRQKLALLKAIKPAEPGEAVRGQYQGYRDEAGNPGSFTETYAALRLHIDNDHWRGVPVLLRTGKALQTEKTEITITFTSHDPRIADNSLTIRLGRAEGISLGLRAKKPGFDSTAEDVYMDFQYGSSFPDERHPTAYERVLMDALRGDKALFATSDEVLESWRILEPLVQSWAKNGEGLEEYAKGSSGPAGAEQLAKRAGISWPIA